MRKIRIFFAFIMTLFLMLGLAYLGLAYYYEDSFIINTYINGVYCTGKLVSEVNEELISMSQYEGLTVKTKTGKYYIPPEEIEYQQDFKEVLQEFKEKQNPFMFFKNILNPEHHKLVGSGQFNENALREVCHNSIFKDARKSSQDVYVIRTEAGFYLKDMKEDVLDESLSYELIAKAVKTGETEVDLYQSLCYYHAPFTEKEQELVEFYEKLENFQSRTVVYLFGEEIREMKEGELANMLSCSSYFKSRRSELPADYKKRFLEKQKDGETERLLLSVDEERVHKNLKKFFSPYNSYKNHSFKTHDGRLIYLDSGNYGNQIDYKKEYERFLKFLQSGKFEYERIPEYKREALYKGRDDIGPNYIEIDMGQQKLFYFEEGKLLYETDVVTGKNSCTVEGVYDIYLKQKDRILRGDNYASPVKYWMPVFRGIGIHDASWRSEYGGDIYIRNGSHGCINTPLEVMEKLYERVEVGTPVIMYYALEEK